MTDVVRLAVSRTAASGEALMANDVCLDTVDGLIPLVPAASDGAAWVPASSLAAGPAVWRPVLYRYRAAPLVFLASVSGNVAQAVPAARCIFWIDADTAQPATPGNALAYARLSGRGPSMRLMGATLTDGSRYVPLALQVQVLGLVDVGAAFAMPRARRRCRVLATSNDLNTRTVAA
jgi:hypothetical protein